MKTKISFIINPKAGVGCPGDFETKLESYFTPVTYKLKFVYTLYPNHAGKLAKKAVNKGAHIVVACGGDGTINEVASSLVGAKVLFGCIPMGSGNGLATHLNIPKNLENAAAILLKGNVQSIDVGKVNDSFFFSNTGFGFDTKVLAARSSSFKSPFLNYAKAVITALFDQSETKQIQIKTPNGQFNIHPFLVMISNSNQLGFQISLHRDASVTDGMLDLIIVEKQSMIKILWMALLVVLRKENYCKGLRHVKVKSVQIATNLANKFCIQQDGELRFLDSGDIQIEILPSALQVIC